MGTPLTPRTIKDSIWKRTGLSQSELPEEVINESIDAALREFSNERPKVTYGQLNILAGVDIYAMPDGITDLLQFYYGSQTTILNNFSFEDILLSSMQGSLANINFGGDIFENPSLTHIFFSKMKELQNNLSQATWEVLNGNSETDGNDKIRLFRTPQADGIAYYEGSGDWELPEITSSDTEIFIKAVMWKVAEGRAMKLAVAADYYEYGGIRMVPAFAFWQKKAEQYRDEYFLDIGFHRGVFIVG